MIADISAAGLDMPDRDYYLKPDDRFKEAREKYRVHVANMFKLAGYSERTRSQRRTPFSSSKRSWRRIRSTTWRCGVRRATDHKTTFAELQKMTPHFDWNAYFDNAKLPRADLNVQGAEIPAEVDRQLAETPVAAWKTYLKWHLLHAAANSLSDPFVTEVFEFHGRYLGGAKEMKPRWKRCVESADSNLGEALGKKYVEKYFPPEAKARMNEMVKNLLAAMGDTIQGLEWMGPETKKKALEKLATFNPKIGYPDKWKDYSKVEITRESYWSDVVAGLKFDSQDFRSTIGKPVDRGRWGLTPPTSDAYYNPLLNEIVFPAGILQPPAFNVAGGRCGELRRDRSGDRTRSQSWLRR